MRKVGIRQFQQNFHKELKDLPFVVTKDGEDYCVVTVTKPVTTTEPLSVINVDLDKISSPDASQITDPNFGMTKFRPAGKCEVSHMNCKNVGKGYQVTFMTDEGEKKKDVFLCELHLKKAKDRDMEVVEL